MLYKFAVEKKKKQVSNQINKILRQNKCINMKCPQNRQKNVKIIQKFI